jgi:hypothetical protein
MKHTGFLLTIGCALVLSACGGGGGDPGVGNTGTGTGTSSSLPVQASTLSPITPENAINVAANAYAASASFGDSSSFASNLLTGVSVTPAAARPDVVTNVLALTKRAFNGNAPKLLTGVTITEACSGGGTLFIDGTLRNPDTFSNGDTISITASNCSEDGEVVNGGFSVTFSSVTGDLANTSIGGATLNTQFKSFSVTSSGETSIMNGDMKIAVANTSATQSKADVSGTSLQAIEQKAGTTLTSLSMTNYNMYSSTNGRTKSNAATFSLTGNSNGLGKFGYSVRNLQPFVTTGILPSSGALVVNGATSSVTATVLSGGNVRVDYSAKGDGVVTATKTLSWFDFVASY